MRFTERSPAEAIGMRSLPLSGGMYPYRKFCEDLIAGMELLLCTESTDHDFLGSTVGVPRRREPGPGPSSFASAIRTDDLEAGCSPRGLS
mmetsp:Transcript_3688/g.10135  ORF Transcript_3688/g.10135 Transcript_3688/m.10135 type:complete len:90 (+) Transcript_3688:495-764(+)